jgi:hypothetical protein
LFLVCVFSQKSKSCPPSGREDVTKKRKQLYAQLLLTTIPIRNAHSIRREPIRL